MITEDLFWSYGYPPGRRITASRRGFMLLNPNTEVFWEVDINTKSAGKIWSGDICLEQDINFLNKLVQELGEHIFLTAKDAGPQGKVLWSSEGT